MTGLGRRGKLEREMRASLQSGNQRSLCSIFYKHSRAGHVAGGGVYDTLMNVCVQSHVVTITPAGNTAVLLQVVETWSQWAASGLLQHTSFRQPATAALQQLADMLHTTRATQPLVGRLH